MTRAAARRVVPALAMACCAALTGAPGAAGARSVPGMARRTGARSASGALAVLLDGTWHNWWRADSAPAHWSGALPDVERAVTWRRAAAGVEWGELRLAGSGEAWRVRVIVVRLDPHRVRFVLDTAFEHGLLRAAWTIDRAPRDALVALNAGQFTGSMPWGWVVLRGREFLAPGRGPLSTAVVIDSSGALRWVSARDIPMVRQAGGIAGAFQSYPTLLDGDGDVPSAVREATPGGVDLGHRDARLAIGALRDGRVLVALTRFDALDGALDFVPFGLTTPEMAALMGALGCQRAVLLDGGISSQLLIRDADGRTHRWPGIRRVPLGLVVVPRTSW